MKKSTITGVSLVTLSAFVFVPMVSHAQLNVDLKGGASTEVNSGIDANVQTHGGVDLGTYSSTSGNATVDVDSGIEVQRESDSKEKNDEKTRVESTSKSSLKVNSAGVAVMSSSQVHSQSDLDVFSKNVSTKDTQVAKIDIESEDDGKYEVEVIYRHKGKFLGFIPVTIKSTTIVQAKADSSTEVRSELSWWSFLVANKNYSKTELESRIKNNTTVKANAKVNAGAQAKAEVAEAVMAEVAAHARAQASASK